MDVSAPMSAILPTLDGPVLQVLAGTTRPLTGRQVHRLARTGSEAGVRRVLHRLVDHGLVVSETAGSATLYSANRHHLAWSIAAELAGLRDRFIDRMREMLAQWEQMPSLVGLYGSAARGDGGIDSDIDILVVRPDGVPGPSEEIDSRGAWETQLTSFRQEVRFLTGNAVSYFEISAADFSDMMQSDDPLAISLRSDLVVLADPESTWQQLGRDHGPERSARSTT